MAERVVIFIFLLASMVMVTLGANSLGGTPAVVLALGACSLLFLFNVHTRRLERPLKSDILMVDKIIRASSLPDDLDHGKRLLRSGV